MSANNAGEQPARMLGSRLSRNRQRAGFAVAVCGPLLVTAAMLPVREALGLDTVLLLFVLVDGWHLVAGSLVRSFAGS